jgi:hypothetical protein
MYTTGNELVARSSSSGKVSRIFTLPTLHHVLVIFVHLKDLFASHSLRRDQQTKYVVQEWLKGLAVTFFFCR